MESLPGLPRQPEWGDHVPPLPGGLAARAGDRTAWLRTGRDRHVVPSERTPGGGRAIAPPGADGSCHANGAGLGKTGRRPAAAIGGRTPLIAAVFR